MVLNLNKYTQKHGLEAFDFVIHNYYDFYAYFHEIFQKNKCKTRGEQMLIYLLIFVREKDSYFFLMYNDYLTHDHSGLEDSQKHGILEREEKIIRFTDYLETFFQEERNHQFLSGMNKNNITNLVEKYLDLKLTIEIRIIVENFAQNCGDLPGYNTSKEKGLLKSQQKDIPLEKVVCQKLFIKPLFDNIR